MVNMQGQATAGVSTVGQAAAVAALDGPQDLVAERAAIYRRRRDLVVDRAERDARAFPATGRRARSTSSPTIAGCLGRVTTGGGADRHRRGFRRALLDEAHVAAVHGAAFGMSPYMRISYATDEATLEEALPPHRRLRGRAAVIAVASVAAAGARRGRRRASSR